MRASAAGAIAGMRVRTAVISERATRRPPMIAVSSPPVGEWRHPGSERSRASEQPRVSSRALDQRQRGFVAAIREHDDHRRPSS